MGLVCQLVFQPVVRLIQIIVSVVEYILVQLCRLITELVQVVTQVLKYVCNTVVHTVCSAVCSVVCGICDLFCGIFGCDCGCENVCNNICNTVTEVVCGWTYVLETVLQYVTRLVCNYILQALIVLLHVIEAVITMVLTWICSLIDVLIRWFLCWTYLAEIFNNTRPRRFRVSPKIVPNRAGHSDWFVYVNNPADRGEVDQSQQGYILSDQGRPLTPVVSESGVVQYCEVVTHGDVITGQLRHHGDKREPVLGRPLFYYAEKVIEISSHMFGDIFAGDPADDGRGTDFMKNLYTYTENVQAWLATDNKLPMNNYNKWSGKYTSAGSSDYFGDRSLEDIGIRVDTDSTCSHPTNTFFHLSDATSLAPPNTQVAEELKCDASQALSFDSVNYLMINKGSSNAVTTYFVSRYDKDDSHVGCNDLLGYTTVTFRDGSTPIFVNDRVLPFSADTNRMMSRIVENLQTTEIVRVGETYLHECGHQSGLLHDSDKPDCYDDTTLHIFKVMDPGASIRRAFTRIQWCMVRGTFYCTGSSLAPFTQAAELPDSGSTP